MAQSSFTVDVVQTDATNLNLTDISILVVGLNHDLREHMAEQHRHTIGEFACCTSIRCYENVLLLCYCILYCE